MGNSKEACRAPAEKAKVRKRPRGQRGGVGGKILEDLQGHGGELAFSSGHDGSHWRSCAGQRGDPISFSYDAASSRLRMECGGQGQSRILVKGSLNVLGLDQSALAHGHRAALAIHTCSFSEQL